MLSKIKNMAFERIEKEGQFLLFIILVSFLATFFLTHLYSIFVPLTVFIKGYHIHHFYYGIVLLAIGGTVGMISNNKIIKRIMSCVLGAGIGFVVDELGLLLSCTTGGRVCEYKFPSMFDVVVYITVIYLILIFFGNWLILHCKINFKRLVRCLRRLF